MYNLLKSLFPFTVGTIYCIGFIYDASYLESFGINHYEFVGGALDYLTIGGMYILDKYAHNLTVIFLSLSVFAISFHPIKRRIPAEFIENNIDLESVPLIFLSLSSLLLIFILPVIADGENDAKLTKNLNNDTILINNVGCLTGSVLRYRDSKIIFYDNKKGMVSVFSDKQLQKTIHTVDATKNLDNRNCVKD